MKVTRRGFLAGGAAFLAGLAVGFWKDENELTALPDSETHFMPQMDADTRKKLRKDWQKAVGCAAGWLL